MLTDGIQLLGASTASNFTIESGASLPASGNHAGELFYRTSVGLHAYSGSAWELVGSSGTVTDATNAANISITNDTTTNATMYPTWVTATTGNLPEKVSSTKLSFNPSTGLLSATGFSGSGASLTSIPNAAMSNSSITVTGGTGLGVSGSPVSLGGTVTLSNTGVTSAVAGTNIAVSSGTGAVTFSVTGTVASSTKATNIAGGLVGYLPYQSAVDATTFLTPGVTGFVLASGGTSAAPTWRAEIYDLALSITGKPTASAIVLSFTTVRAFSLPSSFTSSVAVAGTAATGSTVFTISKNGSSIGTITFAISGTTGTFSGAGGSFTSGDLLQVTAPSSQDTTLADIGITLVATLS